MAGFLTLCSRKVITDNRHARIYIFKKLFGLVIGHVHAAVGPAALIDGSAEAGPPAGVVETNASVKGHPELHRAGISLPLQHRVPLLVCNGENPRRRGMAPGNIAGDKVRLQHLLPVFVKNQVLGRQVYLRICTAVIRSVMARCKYTGSLVTLSPASRIPNSSLVSSDWLILQP